MNKLILGTAFAAACGAALLATPVLAQTTATVTATATESASPATPAKPAAKPARAVPAPGSRNCIRDTGSHIRPPAGQCLPVAGTSYSQRDLQNTGATNVGQALQMLDPSVRVTGGH